MAAPLLAARLPHATIAELLGVSERTVGRWAGEPEVRADAAAIAEDARKVGENRIADLVRKAFDVLERSMDDAQEERVALDAAKTVLDRFGHPVAARSEVSGPDGGPIESTFRAVLMPPHVAEALAVEPPRLRLAVVREEAIEGEIEDEGSDDDAG